MAQSGISNFTRKIATIANGASLSGAVDCLGLILIGLKLPTFTVAADGITFQASVDGGVSYQEMVDEDNHPIVWQVGNSTGNLLALAGGSSPLIAGVTHLKVRSGTSAAAVNQGADRAIDLLFGVPNP